jgi:tetratricopeptide (TPR) repeat protein
LESTRAWYQGEAAYSLRALGRLTEALDPIRAALEIQIRHESWDNSAQCANHLSELYLTFGETAGALREAEQSVVYADRSRNSGMRVMTRATHADTLHQAGHRAAAEMRFREAESMQAERDPDYRLLYETHGFQYCDLLGNVAERAAWQVFIFPHSTNLLPELAGALMSGHAVFKRAVETLKIADQNKLSLLTFALDQLTLGRAGIYAEMLARCAVVSQSTVEAPLAGEDATSNSMCRPTSNQLRYATIRLTEAVVHLRRAGRLDYLPRGLVARAWAHSLAGSHIG